ncbi:MAG: DNA polymerase Y family protein [Steroidobacteraceae bacterium]|nr:DNA polymerase Y family protein [Nevskiaceae bacterium]MCP5340317.1 DNA polymerase Y family protein [Nevskiaceae bacterium]
MARRERAASSRRALLAQDPEAVAHGLSQGLARTPASPVPGAASPAAPAAVLPQLVQGELGLAVAPAELWIALYLPALSVEAVAVSLSRSGMADPGTADSGERLPLAVFEGVAGQARVSAVDAAARGRGVVPGLSLAAALALEPRLALRAREPRRERTRLMQLAEAALEFTPRVSLEPPDAVLLEVRGSLGLFGGAAALCTTVGRCGARLGLTTQLALAPTPLAALVLARADRRLVVTGPERLAGELAPLPLALLRWPSQLLERLAAMGVRTLGAVQRLPREGFARRFGRTALEDLDRLAGHRPDPRLPYRPAGMFHRRCEPSFELEQHEAILRHLAPLLAELERFLRARQAAVLQLRLMLRHRPDPFDGRPRSTLLSLRLVAPQFEAASLAPLFAEQLAQRVLPAAVSALVLRSGALQPLRAGSEALWRPGEHGGGVGRESPALLERLRARLGPGAVYGLCRVAEHRPEHAWRKTEPDIATAGKSMPAKGGVPAGGKGSAGASAGHEGGGRPLWLLPAPQPLRAAVCRALQLLEGPERIESGWWDGRDIARDYYTARDADGVLLWVFRERRSPHGWFLHGVFG